MGERARQRGLFEQGPNRRCFAVVEEGLRKTGYVYEFRLLGDGVGVLTARHRHTLARVIHGVFQQARQRQLTTPAPADLECRLPSGNRSRDRVRSQRSARRDLVVALLTVERDVGRTRSRAAGVDA